MASLTSDRYGKSGIRLTYVDRSLPAHRLRELTVSIRVQGDFQSAYTEGDNSRILPTDTMKNTVYVLARKLQWDSIETFANGLAEHFLDRLPQFSEVEISIEETPWQRIAHHESAFSRPGGELRTTVLRAGRATTVIRSGISGLQIMKTAGSAFSGFLRDELTTLTETSDRIFATILEADWQYTSRAADFNLHHQQIREILLDGFARHQSRSVQQTLYAMGEHVLGKVPEVVDVHLVMPNRHCLLVDLTKFGLDNPNMVFVPTDEPSGYIEARLRR